MPDKKKGEMAVKINYDKLKDVYGISLTTPEDVFLYASSILDYFKFHNKNLTKQQDYRLETLREIADCIEL